jgi:hypothetical protein
MRHQSMVLEKPLVTPSFFVIHGQSPLLRGHVARVSSNLLIERQVSANIFRDMVTWPALLIRSRLR